MKTGLIYAMLDEKGEPFYIGKTINLERRRRKHLSEVTSGNALPKYNKLRKLIREGGSLDIKIIEDNVSEENLNDRERFYIAWHRENGYKLYNLTDGGEGLDSKGAAYIRSFIKPGRKCTEEQKKKISEANKGKKFTEEHRANLSKARRKRAISREQARKHSNTSKGKINIKIYKAIAPDGTEHITDRGLTFFCEQHGLSASTLHAVMRGKRSHHKGWRLEPYVGDQEHIG